MNYKKHEKLKKRNLCFKSNLSKVNNQMIKVCIKVVKVYLNSQQKEKNNINSNMGGLLKGLFFGGGGLTPMSNTRQGCARNLKFGS